ncbi:MAG: glycosyltransferase [Lentisphaeria bacterium]
MKVDNHEFHKAFLQSERLHILMVTNHGMHHWDFMPGLPDTGGQNVFVNQLTEVLAEMGYKITIINRGGYEHPITGEKRHGLYYKDENQRILYIEDSVQKFVRKEDMDDRLPELCDFLYKHITEENIQLDLIISHYWDSAKLCIMLNDKLTTPVKHVWVPHSLGAVKKRNMPPETWEKLRIEERIENEKAFTGKLDNVAATSALIRDSLKQDYGFRHCLFLPPCVNPDRFFYREIDPDHDVYNFLEQMTELSKEELWQCKIISEISRTDKTKRKDVLIKAFAEVHKKHPKSVLVVAIDDNEEELAKELRGLIDDLGIKSHVAAIGNEWERLPYLYSITSVYCSPSVMEGFGMAVQEAAATRVPVVGSNKIPFVSEYLIGEDIEVIRSDDGQFKPLKLGEGGIVVEADDTKGFAAALNIYFSDETLRSKSGECAYHITVAQFTWKDMTTRFLEGTQIPIPNHGESFAE